MDQPNIARFYDGGATDTGRSFFALSLGQLAEVLAFRENTQAAEAACRRDKEILGDAYLAGTYRL